MTRLDELRGIVVTGTGTALPLAGDGAPGEVTNEEVYERLLGADWRATLDARGLSSDRPRTEWGIETRCWCRWPGESDASLGAVELAARAGRAALDAAGIEDVDWLLVAGSTPARISRSTASLVATELGLRAASTDVKSGGASGVQIWLAACALLSAGARSVLVVASEVPSAYLSPDDLVGCFLYGDAASALVLERRDGDSGGLVRAVAGTRRAPGVPFTIPGELPPTHAGIESGAYRFQREDEEYRRSLATEWTALSRELRDARLDWFSPYAVHAEQVRLSARDAGVDEARVRTTLARHGCTGCAGVFLALDELRREGAWRSGSRFGTAAVGGGVHRAALVWEVGA